MQWIIAYDISNNKNRRRAHRALKQHSQGYQKSGFEAQFVHANQLPETLQCLSATISDQDKLLLMRHTGTGPDWQLGIGQTSQTKNILAWT